MANGSACTECTNALKWPTQAFVLRQGSSCSHHLYLDWLVMCPFSHPPTSVQAHLVSPSLSKEGWITYRLVYCLHAQVFNQHFARCLASSSGLEKRNRQDWTWGRCKSNLWVLTTKWGKCVYPCRVSRWLSRPQAKSKEGQKKGCSQKTMLNIHKEPAQGPLEGRKPVPSCPGPASPVGSKKMSQEQKWSWQAASTTLPPPLGRRDLAPLGTQSCQQAPVVFPFTELLPCL